MVRIRGCESLNIAVIFAGGAGQRMNTRSLPKQFLEVHGKPILVYTLECFQKHEDIHAIILVCLKEWIDYAEDLIEKYHLSKVVDVIPGGDSGQDSIFAGVQYAFENFDKDSIVLIHDGVRPLIRPDTISDCVRSVQEHGNAITTTPAVETVFLRNEDDVGKIFDRARCTMARAPQCFYLKDIYEAHLKAREEGRHDFIDSAVLMQHYGARLFTVNGPVENIKITTPMDFYIFRALLDARENMQIIGL